MATRSVTRSRKKATKKRSRTSAAPTVPVVPPGQTVWILKLPFGAYDLTRGLTYYKNYSAHAFVGTELPNRYQPYTTKPYSYLRWIEDDLNGVKSPGATGVTKTPREDQVEDAKALAIAAHHGYRGALVSSAVGTGKTFTVLLAIKVIAKMRGASKILITVDRPARITIPSWRAAIAALGDDDLRWVIVSSDSLKSLIGPNGKPKHRFDLIANDEAHLFRHDSARTSYMRRINRLTSEHAKAPFVISVTATPGHSPAEWGYLAALFAQIHNQPASDWLDFGQALASRGLPFTKQYGRWSWSPEAKSSLRTQSKVIETVRDQLLKHDPPLMVSREAPWGDAPFDVALVELTPDQRRAYELEWTEFRREMRIARSGNDVAKGLALITRLRQKAVMIRTDNTVEAVVADIERGYQVLIATEMVSTAAHPVADGIERAGYTVARIYGSNPDAEEERLRFQRGEAQAVVFNTPASINLQACEELPDGTVGSSTPRRGYFHQPRYSGIAAKQVLGRAHRNFQVCSWSLLAAVDTIEEKAADIMFSRLVASTTSTNGDVSSWLKVAAALGADWIPSNELTDSLEE